MIKAGDRNPQRVEDVRAEQRAFAALQASQWHFELTRYLHGRLLDARNHRAKIGIDDQIARGKAAYAAEYTPGEMAKIEPGTAVYVPLIQQKCRALQNWLTDIMQNATDRPFTLAPTPIPQVPEHLERVAVEQLAREVEQGMVDPADLEKHVDEVRAISLDFARSAAEKASKRMTERIADQLAEGHWRDVYDQYVVDLSHLPAGIIRGPNPTRKKRLTYRGGEAVQVEETVLSFRRVDPDMFYPAPYASGVNESAYLIEILPMTAADIKKLARSSTAAWVHAKALIASFPNGYHPWMLNGSTPTPTDGPDGTYHVLIYNGCLPARLALEFNVPVPPGTESDDMLEVEIFACGDHILRLVLNPYPLGRRPYYVSGFQRRAGDIWFDSLPSILRDSQRMVNASARALVKNMALSAGPLAEVSVDRMAPEDLESASIEPYRVFKVLSDPLKGDAPVWRFHNVPSNAVALLRVYDQFMVEAENTSGIPAFVVGNPDVGGAGRTLGGLSMLMGNAAKGVKRVVSLSDNLVIQPMVEMLYAINMLYLDDATVKADAQVVARGAVGLLQKELSQSRAIELLQVLVQPVVAQSGFVPPSAIPKLLRDVAAGMGYDPDIIPDPALQQTVVDQLRNAGVPMGPGLAPSVVGPAGAGTMLSGLDGRSQPQGGAGMGDQIPAA